ncbi:MAG: hypothetical protein ACVCEJ_04080 [Candidatus Izemoplasmataceae bacterium]
MKRILLLIIIAGGLFFLVGCSENQYEKTEHTLNGYDVYIYDSEAEICAAWYSMGVELDEETTYHIINLCPLSYVVLVEEEYVSLIGFIREHDVSREELEALDYGYFSVTTSIANVLEIDLNDFALESIIVKELNNEIMTPPQWDTFEEIDLTVSDVMDDLALIFSEPLGEKSVCEETMCILLYAQGPINITMVNGDTKIVIELYQDRLNIQKSVNDEFDAVIYHLSDPSEYIVHLYDLIVNRYQEIND